MDDEAPVLTAVRRVLKRHSYHVLLAADGTEALAIYAMNTASIGVVLTDLMMPFMDGVALIKALRKMKPGLPIIAGTGHGEKARLAELEGLDVKAVLHKPFGAASLLHAFHEALHPSAAV